MKYKIFDRPSMKERHKEERDIEMYKFVLEAFIHNPETPEKIRKDCIEKYDAYFGELPELGNGCDR